MVEALNNAYPTAVHRRESSTHLAIPEKIQTWGLRTCNFKGYSRKSMFQGSIKKEEEFFRLVQGKFTWSFHRSWFLTLEFASGVTKFCLELFWNSPIKPKKQTHKKACIKKMVYISTIVYRQ